nr:hypothetical protein [uncultured Devosia sp.]
MRVLLALLITAILQVPAWAGGGGWAFSIRDTAVGPLCVAATEQNGVTVGFYGVPLGPTYAFVKGVNLPRNARSTWQVAGYEWRQFTGAVDSYNGFHIYPGIRPHFLEEVAAGSRLDLYLHDAGLAGNAPLTGTLGLSLRGSSRSIASLLECQAGHYYQPAYRALVVVEAWYALPLPPALPY